MIKKLCGSLLLAMGISHSAMAATQVQTHIPTLQDSLQYKNLKQDVLKNVDLIMMVHGHTQAMLEPGNKLTLNPKLTDEEFQSRMSSLESFADQRKSIYLYDLIGGLYASKLNAVDPQGIYDPNNIYAKKHIEYVQKCYQTDSKNCEVSAYIGSHYLTNKQSDLSKKWLGISSNSGNGMGTYLLGKAYAEGAHGYGVNKVKALELFDLAIQQNKANGREQYNPIIENAKISTLNQPKKES